MPVTNIEGDREIISRLVQGGKFRVFENGVIHRIKNGIEEPAVVTLTTRDRKYGTVSYSENSKQKHYYVHRLVAEAFCENPNNYPQVNHLDGDTFNNKPSNLEWCTAKQNVIHAYKKGLMNKARYTEPCKFCGQPTQARDGVCTVCKRNALRQAKEDEGISKLREKLSSINIDSLNSKQSKMLSLRLEGKSLQEIADTLKMSRQGVQQAIELLVIRSVCPVKTNSLIEKERKRILAKIAKKEGKISVARIEIDEIEKDISSLREALSLLAD